MDDWSIEAIRRMGGTGRLQMMNEMTRSAIKLMAARVRDQHNDWSEAHVRAEVALRIRDAAA